MRKATTLLLRFIGVPERRESPDWWAYFGSFGNDIFGDEDTQMRRTSTPDGAALLYRGVVTETNGAAELADRSVRGA